MEEIIIERVFNASRAKVWDAWTNPEKIQKWWGPEGFSAPSIKIDLKVGGQYIYAMQGPAGTEWDKVMYSGGEFREIVPMEKLVVTDRFCDENGNKISPTEDGQLPDFPSELQATITFEDAPEGKTKLTIKYQKPENEAQYEAILKSGMTEGWQSSFNKLEKIL